jgi:predicted metal-dependent peptidase
MNMLTPTDRLLAARKTLVLEHPFFGALALRMDFRPEVLGRTRTLGTDGRNVFFAPQYVDACSQEELVSGIAHEVMHAALQHHTRRGSRGLRLWNRAGDYAINPILAESGFTLRPGVLLNPAFAGMSAEQIYEILRTQQDQESANHQPEPSKAGSSPGLGGDSEVNAGNPCPNQDFPNSQRTDGPGATSPDPNAPARNDHDELADTPGAVFDAPDPAPQDAEWQVAVTQARQVAEMMGRLPGEVSVAVDEVLKPRVDWRETLRGFLEEPAATDYSWMAPSRRYMASGLTLPSLHSRIVPPIGVVNDTSASTWRLLSIFKAELQAIVDELEPEATVVIMADAKVQRADRFEQGENIEFHAEGCGGTDFRPAFDYIAREHLDLSCVVYLTDGYGVYPTTPCDIPTLWVITSPDVQAPWGETLNIDAAYEY